MKTSGEKNMCKKEYCQLRTFYLHVTCHNMFQKPTDCRWKQNLAEKNGLTLSQMTNFRLFQTEKVSRRQFQI